MNPLEDLTLTLEKPVYGGDCIAHSDRRAVFVPLTLPGETVSAHLTETRRQFARAEIDQVILPSPNRIPARCTHFGSCGGCHYQHADSATQLSLKQRVLRETLDRAGVNFPGEFSTLAANPWEYRNRIRLVLIPTAIGEIQCGYRSRASHNRIAIRECPIAAPLLWHTAQQVVGFLTRHGCPLPLTELELFTNHDQSELLVTLFSESGDEPPPSELASWMQSLQAILPQAAGVRIQHSDGSMAPRVLASAGQSSLTYQAAGYAYQVNHGAFFQVNRWILDDFVSLVLDHASGKSAWDLYAGVGLFAHQLTGRFTEVTAVESSPASLPGLQHNLAGSSGSPVAATTLDFLRRNRQEREPRPDFIVVDPPRAGLGEETTTLLNAIAAPFLVYVSCDPTTLARDLRALTLERYRIETIALVDIFPQTFHIETVVRLRRG